MSGGASCTSASALWCSTGFGTRGGTALAQIGTAVPRENLPDRLPAVASGVLGQHAWNLALFGGFTLAVGILGNWRNSWLGYWLNLAVVSGADLAFIPILWILAGLFSTIGILSYCRTP